MNFSGSVDQHEQKTYVAGDGPLSYEAFKARVLSEFAAYCGDPGLKFVIRPYDKNGRTDFDGLFCEAHALNRGGEYHIAPVLQVPYMYDAYTSGKTFEAVMEHFAGLYNESLAGAAKTDALANKIVDNKNHTAADWTFGHMGISQTKQLWDKGKLIDRLMMERTYEEDMTESEAIELCNTYFSGKAGTKLEIEDITEDTICGGYWFDM